MILFRILKHSKRVTLPSIFRIAGCVWLSCAIMFGVMNGVARGQSDQAVRNVNVDIYSDFKTLTEADGLPSRNVLSLAVDGSTLWVGTDRGLARFDGSTWNTWTEKNGWPGDAITSIAVDPETSDVWLGSGDLGLVRWTGGRFDFFDQFNSGLAGNFVYSLAIDRGRVYATTIGGVSVYDPQADAWELLEPRQADGSQSIFTSITKAAGKLYASALSAGVKELQYGDGQLNWTEVFQGSKLHPFEKIVGTASSKNGKNLWFATQQAVYQRNNEHGSWDKRNLPHALAQDQYVQCLAASDDNTLWLGTDKGLCTLADWESNTWIHYRYNPVELQGEVSVVDSTGTLKTVKPFFSIPYNNIRAIAFDRKNVWIATAEGLVRASNPIPIENVIPAPGQPTDYLKHQANAPEPLRAEYDAKYGNSTRPAVAVYGPRNRTIALPGKRIDTRIHPDRADMQAVDRCMRQFNKQVASNDKRIELFKMSPGYERYGWGLPEDDIVYFSKQSNIAGIVGLLDDRHREASEVMARVEIPFVNVASVNEFVAADALNNPWLFRCWGDQPRQHRVLLDYAVNDLGLARIAIIRTSGHENHTHLNWWKNHALKQKYSIVADAYYAPDALNAPDSDGFVEALKKSNPQVILTWADRKTSVELLRTIRAAGLDALVVTSDDAVTDDFADHVDVQAGNVIALMPKTFHADEKKVVPVVQDGMAQSGVARAGYQENSKDATELNSLSLREIRSYEGTDHIFYAVSMVGKDRRRVKQVLQMMQFSPMGELHYERRHETSSVTYAHLIDGQWVTQSLPVN